MDTSISNTAGSSEIVRPVDWMAALKSGLIVGCIFLIVTRGIPWASSGLISPTVMGRELKSPDVVNNGFNLGIAVLHMLVSVLYACIIIPVAHRLRPIPSMLCAGAIGLILYFINYLIFMQLVGQIPGQREMSAIVSHVGFAMVTAGIYKGFVRRRVEA